MQTQVKMILHVIIEQSALLADLSQSTLIIDSSLKHIYIQIRVAGELLTMAKDSTEFLECVLLLGYKELHSSDYSLLESQLTFNFYCDPDVFDEIYTSMQLRNEKVNLFYYFQTPNTSNYVLLDKVSTVMADMTQCFSDNLIIRSEIGEEGCLYVTPNYCNLGDLDSLSLKLVTSFENAISEFPIITGVDVSEFHVSHYAPIELIYNGEQDFLQKTRLYCVRCALYESRKVKQCQRMLDYINKYQSKTSILQIHSSELNKSVLTTHFYLKNTKISCNNMFKKQDLDSYHNEIELQKAILYADQLLLEFELLQNNLTETQKLALTVRHIRAYNPNNYQVVTSDLLSELNDNYCTISTFTREYEKTFRFSYISIKLEDFENITNKANKNCDGNTTSYVIVDFYLHEGEKIIEFCENQTMLNVINQQATSLVVFDDKICFNTSMSGSLAVWDLSGQTSQFVAQEALNGTFKEKKLYCDTTVHSGDLMLRIQRLIRQHEIGFYLFDSEVHGDRYEIYDVYSEIWCSSVYYYVITYMTALFSLLTILSSISVEVS